MNEQTQRARRIIIADSSNLDRVTMAMADYLDEDDPSVEGCLLAAASVLREHYQHLIGAQSLDTLFAEIVDDALDEIDWDDVAEHYSDLARKLIQEKANGQLLICGLCGGDLQPLGQLGSMTHYRCRHCGADFSQKETT